MTEPTDADDLPLPPRCLAALGIDLEADRAFPRRIRSWSDAEIERVLASPLQSDAQGPWLYLELVVRSRPIPGMETFSEQLQDWTARSLTDALEVYATHYPLEKRAALLAEVLRRGLELGDPRRHPNQRVYQVCLSFLLLILVLGLTFIAPYFVDTRGNMKLATVVLLVFLALLTLLRPLILRRLKRMAGGEVPEEG